MNTPAAYDNPLARHSERRSIILCAIGAVTGLIVAGTGLFTAQGTRIAGVPAEDVAMVNQVPILMSDYIANLRAAEGVGLDNATPAQRRKILDQMISEELYVQRSIELGQQNDITEVRAALVGAVEAQQATDAAATQPDEDTLIAFYNQRISQYEDEGTITLIDMIAPDEAAAGAAVAEIRAGKPVTAAASVHGLRPSGKMADGEEYYFAGRIHLGDRLFDAASKVPTGKVSDPITAPDGIHVIAVTQNTPPKASPYEMVRDKVLSDYRADKINRMRAGADAFLRRRADIQIAKGFE
ncbi:peptidyl-prolyl cis-trans isomerase [Nitrospirillum viridazoti]|uniref:Parvulin-like PPIase n=1 Tax=Nitrospirillum amazonense TaxID=28077 RepID=A0A560HIP3_9PROT|nr:peptidyl-prolyl cis-trans isomerase [Nitrospirillum amazonense]TWB46343.1 parvulin-like peptidyl-prolyl cis-trans isomerase protein [Nitrospirillum amazonense]